MGTHYSCQWTPSCMYLLCSFSVPEINSASNKKGVSELFLTHLFIYTNSANLTSLYSNIKYIDNQLVTVIKIQMICKCKYKTI